MESREKVQRRDRIGVGITKGILWSKRLSEHKQRKRPGRERATEERDLFEIWNT